MAVDLGRALPEQLALGHDVIVDAVHGPEPARTGHPHSLTGLWVNRGAI
jgi:hypothetical protein